MCVAQVDQRVAKSRNQVVDKRLLALQQELTEQLTPVVAVLYELVLKEIDKCPLIPGAVISIPS